MTRLVVSTQAVRHNAQRIQEIAGDSRVIAVVKGNGYGMGLVPFATLLADCGITYFAVAALEEGIKLRQGGITQPILLLSPVSDEEEATALIQNHITATVGSVENAALLSQVGQQLAQQVTCHLKLDTGFGRYGFEEDQQEEMVQAVRGFPYLMYEGVFTHLSDSFGKTDDHVKAQYQCFVRVLESLAKQGVTFGMRHIANSCGTLRFPYLRLEAVRVGSAFLGRLPTGIPVGLQRVGYLENKINAIRQLPAGHNIGYANLFTTKRSTTVAVIQTGYIDGLRVAKLPDTYRFKDILRYTWQNFKLMGKPAVQVEIGSKKCPVLGRVSMCNIVVDVTGLDCKVGDLVKMDVNPLMVDSGVERRYE